jgi:hypothetical protein
MQPSWAMGDEIAVHVNRAALKRNGGQSAASAFSNPGAVDNQQFPGLQAARAGNVAGSTSTAMARATAGRREINPAFSSVKIIWCTVGGVTRKKRAMSDCAGGRPFTNV